MSTKRQISFYSGMRLDIPHLKSIESSITYDFDAALQGLVTGTSQPYLIRGFDVIIPSSAISATALEIKVADSAILHSSASESGTILVTESNAVNEIMSPSNPKVRGAFQNGVINYLSLEYIRAVDASTADQTAGWSQSQKTEYQRTAPIGRILSYRFVISTSGFSTNLPLYLIGVSNTGAITHLTKSVPSLFRLGRGGTNPNPFYSFTYKNLINEQTGDRTEWSNTNSGHTSNPVTVVPGNNANAFNYGDFAITSLKEWMDAIMSRFKEMTGSSYWYTDSALTKSPNTFDVWWDANGSFLTGSGNISYNMILETDFPDYGAYQSAFTQTLLTGDSYIVGVTSGNKATLSSFNGSQLIVSSLTSADFVYGEVLQNRRLFRPVIGNWSLDDASNNAERWAALKRAPLFAGASVNVTSWSFVSKAYGATVTLDLEPHLFKVGDIVSVFGLDCDSNQPNGVHQIKKVTLATIEFDTVILPVGVPSIMSASVRYDSTVSHPFLPKFNVNEWSISGLNITFLVNGHNFITGQEILFVGVADEIDGVHTITVNSNQSITITVTTAPTIPATFTGYLSPDSILFNLTVNGSTPDTYNKEEIMAYSFDICEIAYVLGEDTLPSIPPASGSIVFDGVVALSHVSNPAQISAISYDNAPISIAGSSVINSDILTVVDTASLAPQMSVTGTGIPPFTIITSIIDSTTVKLSNLALVTGSATYLFTSPYIEVTCFEPHGFSTIIGPIDFTIYGNQSDTAYAISYGNVSIIYVNAFTFKLVGESIFNAGSYTNTTDDKIFAKSPNNPYAGPILWDNDLIVKGIIGDKSFTLLKTATATGTDVANKFNINGQTGTAFIQDGEVSYITLKRNISVSGGANYSTGGASQPLAGVAPFTDENGLMLKIGDFIKFEGEPENFWYRISNGGFPTLELGDSLPNGTTTIYLVSDNEQVLTSIQRPPKSGKLVYCRGAYDEITVAKHWQVEANPDIYWVAFRRDNGSLKSKIYMKGLEIEAGESRPISDNEPANLLIYTGAGNEAAINPNYTLASSSDYAKSETVDVGVYAKDIDARTRTISFETGPSLGFQKGDKISKTVGVTTTFWEIDSVLTSKTITVTSNISAISPNDTLTYHRNNYNINDTDNLTLAIRKEDRELAKVNTNLTRPIYDESVYPVLITLTANSLSPTVDTDSEAPLNADQIISGSYIYLGGNANNPSALAWVLHGTKTMSERVEGSLIGMSGGKWTEDQILVHVISGTFPHNSQIKQVGRTGIVRRIVNPSDEAFPSTKVMASSNVELILPPNKRTAVVGSEYVKWPTHCTYKASIEPQYCGEELMVIVNDTVREANLDYAETFGGPKGKILITRDMPLNSRFRFRLLPSYGSALAKIAGNVTLQIAYDGGNIVNLLTGRPVSLLNIDRAIALNIVGGIELDCRVGGVSVGGLMPSANKSFDIGQELRRVGSVWSAKDVIKTHDTHPNSGWTQVTCAGTSTGTSASVLPWSLDIPENTALRLKATSIARRADGTLGVAGFEIHGTFYRLSGDVAQAGDAYSLITGFAGNGINYAISFGILGQSINLVAFGQGVVEWACSIDYQFVSLPA